MTGAPSILADLLADCEAHGIRLALAGDGGLVIDAPQNTLTPELLGRLKAHKGELLAVLQVLLANHLLDAGQVQRGTEHGAFGQIDFPIAPDGGEADVQPALEKPSEFGVANLETVPAGKNDAERGEWAAREPFLNRVDHALIVPSLRMRDNDSAPAATVTARNDCAKTVCRCGSTTWRDVSIHDGQSVRRDCGRCGRFLAFPVWYGKDALQNEM